MLSQKAEEKHRSGTREQRLLKGVQCIKAGFNKEEFNVCPKISYITCNEDDLDILL